MTDLVLAIRMKADGSGQVKAEVREVTGGVDGLKKKLEDTGRAGGDAGRGVESFRSKLGGLKTAIAGLGIAALVRDIARTGVEFQKYEVGLLAATGSTQGATAELAFLREEAERLGLRFTSLAGSYTQLAAAAKGTALEGQATRDIFTAVAEASRVMGLSSAEAEGALRAIGQMMSKGTVQAEELRGQLGERIPGAFQLAARAMGVTTAELGDMLQEGEVLAEDLLPKLAKELRKAVQGGVEGAANTPAAEFERMSNALDDLKAAIAESGLLSALASLAKRTADIAREMRNALEQIGLVKARLESVQMARVADELAEARAGLVTLEQQRQTFERLAGQRTRFSRTVNPTALAETEESISAQRREIQRLERELNRLRTRDIDRAEFTGEIGFTPDPGPRNFAAEERELMAEMELDFRLNGAEARRAAEQARRGRGGRDLAAEEAKLTRELEIEFARRTAAYRDSLDDRLEALERSLDDEVEREQRRYREAVALLEEAEQQRITTSAEAQRIREDLEEQHLERIYQLSEERIKRTEERVDDSTKEMKDLVREVGLSFSSAFEEAVVSGGKLRDVLSGLLDDLAKLVLRKGVTEPLLGGFSDFLGGILGGGLPADYGGFPDFSLAFHSGGVVGQRAAMRAVDPRVFAGAPRYHGGGLVANERPAVLQLGEEVLTRNDPRHVANGGGRGVSVTQNISIDARGADQGVEQRLRVALERNKRETIAQVRSEIVRGGPMRGLVRG